MNKEKMPLADTRAEMWRTVASIAQIIIGLASLIILIAVHFL